MLSLTEVYYAFGFPLPINSYLDMTMNLLLLLYIWNYIMPFFGVFIAYLLMCIPN